MKINNGIISSKNGYVEVSYSLEDFTSKLINLNTTLEKDSSKGMTKSI
jgi:hypothetical protein